MGGAGSSGKAKGSGGKRLTTAKNLKSDRRLATKILERYGGKQADQKFDQHARAVEWAKRVLSEVNDGKVGPIEPHTSMKRQRSQEGESALGKKPRVGVAPMFSEIAKLASSIELGLPAEPSTPTEIEEILRYCNPSLPTQDWKVVRLERTEEPYRRALILLNKESLYPLSIAKGAISYGFERVVLKILPIKGRADGPLPPAEVEESGRATHSKMDIDPILSDTVSTDGESSCDNGSVFSLERLFEDAGVDSTDDGAALALLERSLEDEDLPN
nr:uncharacterized protein LOC118683792 [Bactrocera oleae]